MKIILASLVLCLAMVCLPTTSFARPQSDVDQDQVADPPGEDDVDTPEAEGDENEDEGDEDLEGASDDFVLQRKRRRVESDDEARRRRRLRTNDNRERRRHRS